MYLAWQSLDLKWHSFILGDNPFAGLSSFMYVIAKFTLSDRNADLSLVRFTLLDLVQGSHIYSL